MIRIIIESGINASTKKGKKTTNEQDFIIKFIAHHFPHAILDKDFEVIGINGKDNIDNSSYIFKENTILGGTNLLIFDADSPSNNGGFTIRKRKLQLKKNILNIDFDLFLWPNNNINGDFESMLLRIVQPKHKGLISCFKQYEGKVKNLRRGKIRYMTPGRKGCAFSYISSIPKTQQEIKMVKNGFWLFENPEYWNLDHEFLIPLKNFFNNYL